MMDITSFQSKWKGKEEEMRSLPPDLFEKKFLEYLTDANSLLDFVMQEDGGGGND